MNTEYLYCFSCMCPIDAVDAVCPHCGHDNHVRSNGPGYLPQTVLMNQYLVGMKKGHGGFGVTYIGIDLTLERRVAIKEYFPREMATRDGASHSLQSYSNSEDDFARGRRRALAEGRTVASITPQPNIVQIHSAFEANNTIYIVMEYIDGETLAQLVAHRNAPLSWEEVRRYFFPLISALAQVHRSGIIHRDVSPDNIMIRRSDDCAVLLDFGAAYTAAANGMTEHTTRSVIIRPSYTPLEQRSPNSVLDARTDEHAMCATMYFALTGKAPTDALMRALGEEVPTPRSLGSDIPVSMEAVLLRGMSLNTADRYDDLEQLTQAFSGKRVEPSFPSSSAPKKTRKTNPLIIGGAAAAGALALSMLAAALIPDGSTPQPETSATPLVSPAEELAAIAPAPTTATPAPTTATPAPTTATPAPTTATPAPTTATPAPTTATPAPTTATPAPTTATPAPTTATPAPTTATPAPPTPTPFPTSIAEDYYVIHPNENGTCIITRFNDETAATLDIPAKIKGYTVTAIGEYAFGGLANLTTVTVPDSVASIADNAFSGCTNVVLIAKPGSDAEEAISEANLPTPTPVPTPTPTPTPCPTLKPASTAAKNITTGDYTILAYEDGTCTITSYNGTKSKLEIPQKLAGYRVTDIGYIAFAYNESIISVTIPEGVTSIGNSAFVGCSNLKSVSLPEGLVSIGQYSFDSCYALASINLPGTLTSIGDSAFSDCNSLNSVTLPNELKWIGDYTFTDCGALTSLKLSSKLEYLDRNAFTFGGYSTTNHPTSIVMPNSVKAIDSHAIRVMDPKKTINITLPAGIQYISADAFYFFHSSDKLTFSVPYGTYAFDYVYYGGFAYTVTDKPSNVQIPTEDGKKFTVNGITAQSYSDGTCRITGLTHYGSKLIIPERLGEYTVTGIDTYAFYECSFKSVILPKTLKYIGPYAFTRCTALTSIELPDSITFMGRSVFYDCEALEHVKLPANLTALPDCTFYKCTNLVRVDWPETLVAIGHDAFACSGIKEVKIPDSVSLIASCAFTSCENLEQVQFPANLKYIGSYAFSDSKKLDEVILPDGIRYVGGHAFSECGLIDVVLPGSIEFIGASSFGYTPDSKADFTVVEGSYAHQYLQEEGFTRLYSYDTLQPTPTPVPTTPTPAPAATPTPTIPPIPATNVTPTPTPAVSTTSKVIDSYTVRIFADGTCETISYNKTPPTNLIIPAKLGSNSVIAIGEGVYQGMNMRSANIKDGVQHLGKRAFAGCGSLSEVTLPGTLLTIGDEAFADCGDLTSITLPKGLTTIGSAAFSGSGLTQVSIPEGVTSIGENAFCNTQLTSLHIPASVTQAGQVICDDRVKLTIDPANPVYRVENNRLVPIAPPATPTPAPTSTPSQHIVSSAAQPLADHALPGHADVEDAYMLPDDAPEMLSLSVAAAGDAYILSGKVKDVHTAVTMTVTCGYESPVSYTGVSGSFSLTLAGYTPGTALQVTLSATLPDERSATTTYDLSSCTDMKDTPSLCTIIHGLTIYNYKDGLLDTLSVVFPMDDMDVTAIYDRYGSLTSYTYVRDGGIYTLDVNGQFLRVHVAANGQSYTFTRENGWAVFNSEWLEFLLCEAPTDFDLTAVPALTITQEEFIP